MLRIHTILNRQFEGMTIFSAAPGTWHGQSEQSDWYLIAVPESRVEELKVRVLQIGKTLGQKQMYFQVGPPSARLLDIDDDTPPLSE